MNTVDQPDQTPNQPDDVIELRALIGVLRRQARVVVYSTAACLALAVLFLAFADKKFTATALLEVDPSGSSALQATSVQRPVSGDENARVDSEVEIMKSDAIALAVIDELGLTADVAFQHRQSLPGRLASFVGRANASGEDENADLIALGRFRDAITVRRKGLTYLIEVSAEMPDPAKARDLANAVADRHISRQIQSRIDAALAARDILNTQIAVARARLSASEARLEKFLTDEMPEFARHGAIDAGAQARFDATAGQISQYQDLAQATRAAVEADEWGKVAGLYDDPELARLAGLKMAGASDMELTFEELDTRLRAKAETHLSTLDAEMNRLEREASQISVDLRRSLDLRELPADLVTDLYTLRQEAGIARNQYDLLLEQARETEAEAGLQLATTRVVSPAILSLHPSFPDPGLVMLVALGAAAALGVGLAFLNEYFVGGMTSETHLASVLNLPVAASVPFADEAGGGRFSPADRIIDMPLNGYSEALRKLRATIDLALRDVKRPAGDAGKGRVIMVTSAQTNEGKTTTALALARTYAVAGKKTLLIDADLRRPSIHTHLGVEPASGFGEYLAHPDQKDGSHEFYARDPASSLALILGSERAIAGTDDLLNSRRFAAMVEQAREVYDVTIIDTPPVLPVVDALYVAPFADAIVTTVKWASTSQSDVKAANGPIRNAMRQGAVLLPVLTMAHARPVRGGYDQYEGAYSAVA